MTFETETPALPRRYAPRPGAYDEVYDSRGEPRQHWNYVLRSLGALGIPELQGRMRDAVRLLHEDGATYSVYGDPQGWNRPWALDPIPLLISSEEWARVEPGLVERAELLNQILLDLYGPRDLIRLGLLPLELVYSHRGFMRACDGIQVPGRHQLVFYGADLARTADGAVCVLDDRTQAPSGAAYALENRSVMARILPSLYRDSHVHRLAPFFHELRNTLHRLAPEGGDAPRVVVLTPGPHNEAYFEHAYLANYMGHTLVQGSDLSVRDGRVWLRSVRGFEPVDVIVRRTDDFFCDPLELRQDSQLGVPGLVEAARRGTVTIVNPLGSGVLENPGILPFLPAIAQHFLGRELRIGSVPTWWCGRQSDCDYVLTHIERLVIRTIHSRGSDGPILGERLSCAECDALRDRIREQPHLYVGQESVELSSVPVVVADGLAPRPVVCRTFLVAREDSFVALPGGLTRFGPDGDSHLVSNQLGGASKDTWVIASEPEKQTSPWTNPDARLIPRDPDGLLSSRATESLFWFGRYAERAGETIGLLRVILSQLSETELGSRAGRECFECLLVSLTHLTKTYPGFVPDDAALCPPAPELHSVATAVDRTGSLAFNVARLLQSAHAVRDLLSADTWRTLNDMESHLRSLEVAEPASPEAAEPVLNEIHTGLQALAGVTMETMLRGPGWSFLDLGRRLERALSLCSVLRSTMVQSREGPVEGLLMESVLAAAGTLASYRRLYRSQVQFETMLDLLMTDESNPRSLGYQTGRLLKRIADLPRKKPAGARLSEEEGLILQLSTDLRLSNASELSRVDPETHSRAKLDGFLFLFTDRLQRIGHVVTETYFSPGAIPQQLVTTDSDDDA